MQDVQDANVHIMFMATSNSLQHACLTPQAQTDNGCVCSYCSHA